MSSKKKLLLWTGSVVGALVLVVVALMGAAAYIFSTLLDEERADPASLQAQWENPFPEPRPDIDPTPGPRPFGSGHFGAWVTDRFGLPAYA